MPPRASAWRRGAGRIFFRNRDCAGCAELLLPYREPGDRCCAEWKVSAGKEHGNQFDSEFLFPSDYGIDVFDLSIILNNALNNALEACEVLSGSDPEAERFISVTSYCKNNMFLIEVKNSFDGTVCVTEDGGLKSRKQDTHRHGLGFQNIVRCVDKYLGSADYTCCDRTFTLIVMLQKI